MMFDINLCDLKTVGSWKINSGPSILRKHHYCSVSEVKLQRPKIGRSHIHISWMHLKCYVMLIKCSALM